MKTFKTLSTKNNSILGTIIFQKKFRRDEVVGLINGGSPKFHNTVSNYSNGNGRIFSPSSSAHNNRRASEQQFRSVKNFLYIFLFNVKTIFRLPDPITEQRLFEAQRDLSPLNRDLVRENGVQIVQHNSNLVQKVCFIFDIQNIF